MAAYIILPPKNNDHGFLPLQVLSPADPGSRVGLVVIKPKPPVPLPTGPEKWTDEVEYYDKVQNVMVFFSTTIITTKDELIGFIHNEKPSIFA